MMPTTFDTSRHVIYFSRFSLDSSGNGGCRRTVQIFEALKDLDIAFLSCRDYPPDYKKNDDYADYLQSGCFPTEEIGKWEPLRRTDIEFMRYVSWLWTKMLKETGTLKLALIDDPVYFSPLVEFLASLRVPMIALCHNIETLSKSQVLYEYQLDLLNKELSCLRLCSLAVTISREETFLLNNLGIDCFYYPYSPVNDIRARMLAIREKRKVRAKSDFLLVGTAYNPPTLNGMKEVIRAWDDVSGKEGGARLFVAGFGTEPLTEFADGEKVIFKGPMADDDLDGLLSGIKGAVVYQRDGAGALTKIAELLMAGVPVIVNSHAARSYYHLDGVIEFSDIRDLSRVMKDVENRDTALMPQKESATSLLAAKIRSLLALTKTADADRRLPCPDDRPSSGEPPAFPSDMNWKRIAEESRDQLQKLNAECNALRHAFDEYRAAVDNSVSWRITLPLRYVWEFFHKKEGRTK